MKKTTAENANTSDILYSLTAAVPAAINQARKFNLAEMVGINQNTTPIEAGILTGKWIRNNIKYKIDPFDEQNIQLPSSLLTTKKGDCKSLSLLWLSIIESAGYNGGFRFVAYRNKPNFTHVYNFICLGKNNFHTFDVCNKNLTELQTYTKHKDMKVNYLAGTEVMMGITMNNKPSVNELMRDDRYMNGPDYIGKKKLFKNLGDKIKKQVGKEIKFIKGVGLAPARGPFLLLLDVNFRGLARKMDSLRKKNPKLYEEFWLKIGGKVESLNAAVNKGKDKKPFLGERKSISGATAAVYIGGNNSICRVDDDSVAIGFDPASVTAALTAAAGIIAAANKLFKKEKIDSKPEEGGEIEIPADAAINPEGGEFAANDPASPEAETYAKTGRLPALSPSTTGGVTGFKPSPMLLIGGLAAAAGLFMLLKKKK